MTSDRVVKNATTGRAWVIVVTWFVVLGSALLALFAITPWPLVFFCLAGVAVKIRHRSTATFGIAASILLHLAAVAVLIQLSPATRLPLDLTVSALLILEACAVAWAVTSATRPPRRDLFITLARRSLFFVVPVVACLVEAISSLLGRSGVAWAMGNDSAFNVMSARILFADGGVNSRLHFNGSPEPHSLLTVVTGAGRWNVGSWDLFQHDVSAYAQLWFLLIIATAVLSALVARQVIPSGTPTWFAIVATNAVALVPLCLFVAGYAIRFGFFNATLSLVILLSAWVISRSESVSPGVRLSALGLASLSLLATWGPLAVIPMALGVNSAWHLIRQVRSEGKSALRQLFLPGAVIMVNVVYVAVITVADLFAAQGALANDGGIFWLNPYLVAAVVIVTLLLLAINARLCKSSSAFVDGLAATFAGSAGAIFLIYQRRDEATVWGYYPVKFSWLLVTLFSIVCIALIFSLMSRLKRRGVILAGAVAASLSVVAGFVIVSPAVRDRALDALPLLAVAGIPSPHPRDYAASVMFRNKENGVNTIAVNALTLEDDAFINLWLVQMEPTLNSLDVRVFAYGIDGNNMAQVCAAIETMAAPVRILTQEQGLRERLLKECPNANFEIVAPRL